MDASELNMMKEEEDAIEDKAKEFDAETEPGLRLASLDTGR